MFRFLFIILGISSAMTFAQNPPSNDSAGINGFIDSFDAAWNSHNYQAMATLWKEDGDLITPWGRWMMSQGQIEKYFAQEAKGPFGKSTITQSIDSSRFVTPQIVFLDATMRVNGIVDAKGNIPPSLIQHASYLVTKIGNQWKIIAARIYQFQPQHVD